MKKILLCFLSAVLCLSALTLKAQDFNAGATAGCSISQVDGDGMAGFHYIGFQGGLFVNRFLDTKNILQGELRWVMKGSGIESTKNTEFRREISSSYLDIALYYKRMFTPKIYGKAGLVPSVLLSKKETYAGYEVDYASVPEFRKFSLLFSIGAEYWFTENWFVEATFNYSLISLRKGAAQFTDYGAYYYRFIFENGQFYNYLKFSLGYKF